MSDKTYTIGEAATRLNATKRTIQRKLRALGIPTKNGAYVITDELLRELNATKRGKNNGATTATKEPTTQLRQAATEPNKTEHIKIEAGEVIVQQDGSVLECFSAEKYQSLEQALVERLELKIELREVYKRLDQLQQWKEDFMKYTTQRNTIEAFDKGLIQQMDKDEVDDSNLTEPDVTDIQQHIQAKRSEVIRAKKQFTEWIKEM